MARIRVTDRGGCYIPSSEIRELPEVKEMQRLAKIIVEKSREMSYRMLEGLPEKMEEENFNNPE
ncbi:hypothetical protein KASHIRA_00130 [Serratia phage vB_SmaM-Kashira]|nr:hypothetical protein [Acinetobacter phage ABPH49]URC22607.1 hypothetical protein KASHIRA_00130 [Serratia phage vB_SmaM-Kashira]